MDWGRGVVLLETSRLARRSVVPVFHAASLVCTLMIVAIAEAAPSLADGRAKLLARKYAEAEEILAKTAADEPVPSALGIARCQISVGEYDKAAATLAGAYKDHAKEARLPAELAKLA